MIAALSLGASVALAQETIKVGVLHSLSGTMAISETTLKDVMLMLIEEQNKKGGVLVKKLEAVVVDPASNWPLFAETHDKKLAQFITSKSDAPSWMHLSFRRSHAFELPEDQRSLYLAFIVQCSADGFGSTLVVVPKTIPLGRYLDRATEWTTVYLGRFMLQHRKLADGTDAIVILDCEGAAKADLQ
jgi:uncharacterized protein (DUF1684 family)